MILSPDMEHGTFSTANDMGSGDNR